MRPAPRSSLALGSLVLTLALGSPASAGRDTLTAADLAATYRLGELMSGGTFSAAEKAAILKDEQAQFRRDPAKERRDIAADVAAVKQLQTLSPVRRVDMLHLYFHNAYWNHQRRPQAFSAAVLRHRPVLAADPETRYLLTAFSLRAWFGAHRFVASLAGVNPISAAQEPAETRDLVRRWRDLPGSVQQRIDYAPTYGLAIQTQWAKTGRAERAQLTALARQQVKTTAQVGDYLHRLGLTSRSKLFPSAGGAPIQRGWAKLVQDDLEWAKMLHDAMEAYSIGYQADSFVREMSRW
ncbi:hypothetical protein [Deinococcus aestuarii]|uniref:hypothetical protein n=1 Tax=Deinococcus aestuarii TaxID=2774531 RepID=UPI001C0C3CD1|nr:hypothetical protein [Deinococcus aestuarii]